MFLMCGARVPEQRELLLNVINANMAADDYRKGAASSRAIFEPVEAEVRSRRARIELEARVESLESDRVLLESDRRNVKKLLQLPPYLGVLSNLLFTNTDSKRAESPKAAGLRAAIGLFFAGQQQHSHIDLFTHGSSTMRKVLIEARVALMQLLQGQQSNIGGTFGPSEPPNFKYRKSRSGRPNPLIAKHLTEVINKWRQKNHPFDAFVL